MNQREEWWYFTDEQKEFLNKIKDEEFYNITTPAIRSHIRDYTYHTITKYGPTGKKVLNEIREAYIKYRKSLDNSN